MKIVQKRCVLVDEWAHEETFCCGDCVNHTKIVSLRSTSDQRCPLRPVRSAEARQMCSAPEPSMIDLPE
jgi:hypothetical protein